MEVAVVILVVCAIVAVAVVSLSADASERFSLDWQVSHEEWRMTLDDRETRERLLYRWVTALAAVSMLMTISALACLAGFLAENAKGHPDAMSSFAVACLFGAGACVILTLVAVYHLVGMMVRLRACRRVLKSPTQSDENEQGEQLDN